MRSRPADAGDTLVEILVTLAVLSIGIVALLAGLATNVTTTVVNRDQSQVDSTLAAAAEVVKSLSTVSFACSGGSPLPLSTSQVPRAPSVSVEYGPPQQVDATPCSQMVRIPVRVQGNGFDLSVDVVRRP